MKNPMKLIVLAAALIVLGLVCFAAVRCLTPDAPPVGIVDGLDFSAGPSAAGDKLGKPLRVADKMDTFECVDYVYATRMFDTDMEVELSFIDDSELVCAVGIVPVSGEETDRLAEAWYQRLEALYKDEEGFQCDPKALCLSTNQGAIGLDCEITKAADFLRIRIDYVH